MLTSIEIRKKFFTFFQERGHVLIPSAPIVIKNDPSLLFTNAGMNQFKDIFLNITVPKYSRVVDTQKCLRVSGKHNDLEEVGVDNYHHTMFEMLGNWSFGDYFKEEAIKFSWQLLTQEFGLEPDRLYATVFAGDIKENLPPSSIAYREWQKYLPMDHIVMGGKKDNFWEMGETGPCGPCSEIHIDLRPDEERKRLAGKELVNKDHPNVIEIWNNVFIQFNRKKDGNLEKLKNVHVDTGMGLERLVRVIQGKTSNYDTDIFMPSIYWLEKQTKIKYEFSSQKKDIAFRVIADHIRAIMFTIADGQLPSNTGAGYVIRRILRRAVRYYYSFLNYHKPLLFNMVELIAEQYEEIFPELHTQKDFLKKVIEEEELGFLKTLANGLGKFEEMIKSVPKGNIIPGELVFELLDTFGFPLDLTKLLAQEKNLFIDELGFEKAMQLQKQRSRAATSSETSDWIIVNSNVSTVFIGYQHIEEELTTQLIQYRTIKIKDKKLYQWVIEKNPFYAESGGQVGDTGILKINNEIIPIIDTQKENNLSILVSEECPTSITNIVKLRVNYERRHEIACHHSATHLLHASLKEVLGHHVNQKGSLVNDAHLRFDFTHFAKLTEEEIDRIEALVNAKIKQNITVHIQELPKEEALKLGVTALFGEKYGDIVRVVTIDPKFSMELCGGTHVQSTGELGAFIIKHETAIASGVRRIEAIASAQAIAFYEKHVQLFHHINNLLKGPKNVVTAIEKLIENNKQNQKYIEKLEHHWVESLCNGLQSKVEQHNNTFFLCEEVPTDSTNILKKMAHLLQSKFIHQSPYLFCLFFCIDLKIQVIVLTPKNYLKFSAVEIVTKIVCPLIEGEGGGQANLAMAGGEKNSELTKLKPALVEYLYSKEI